MKRAFLIVVSALALVGLLIADIAWPKASSAEEIPAAAPAAQAAATPDAAASSVPQEATAETSGSASEGTRPRKLRLKACRVLLKTRWTSSTSRRQQVAPRPREPLISRRESKEAAAFQHNAASATNESDRPMNYK